MQRRIAIAILRIAIAVLCWHSLATNRFVMVHRGGTGDIPIVLKRRASVSVPVVATNGTALLRRIVFAEVLAWVAGLVAHVVQQFEEPCCEKGSEKRPYKVDPEVTWEVAVHDCWAEGAGEVKGTSGKVDSYPHALDTDIRT